MFHEHNALHSHCLSHYLIDLKNTEPIFLGTTNKSRFLQVSGHNIFINESTHKLSLYAFLFKQVLLNIYALVHALFPHNKSGYK